MSKQVESKKQIKKTGLGRGLGSLLGNSTLESTSSFELPDVSFGAKSFTKSSESSLRQQIDTKVPIETIDKKIIVEDQKAALEKVASQKELTSNTEKVEMEQIAPPKEAPSQEINERVHNQPSVGQKISIPDEARIWNISVEKLKANENQPRKIFEKEHLNNLSASIKEKGILQPITARKLKNGDFEIVAGERRWRAAQTAGLHEVPVILKDINEQDSLELALIENIQRQDLNPIEEAEAYFHLIRKYKLTQQQLSEKLCKERATIANILRLLNLTQEVRSMVSEGALSLGQAKVLLSLSDPEKQKRIAKKAAKQNLSVRALEKLVANEKRAKAEVISSESVISDRVVASLGNELQKLIGTKVSIDYKSGKGKISINFYSDDELNQVVDKIRNSWK